MKTERTWWRILRNLGTIFLVNVVILFFLVLGFGREYLRNHEIERSIRQLEDENLALEDKKLEALTVISSLSSEYYLEGEARKKHGLAKPGEELVIVDDADGSTFAESFAAGEDDATGAAAHWFYYFFDHEHFAELRAL